MTRARCTLRAQILRVLRQRPLDGAQQVPGIEGLGEQFALVLTSPLRRALETCELAGLGARAQVDPDLLEWNYGEYEGLTSAEIHEHAPGWLGWGTLRAGPPLSSPCGPAPGRGPS